MGSMMTTMSNIWISSDSHLGHEKILTMGSGRPFPTVEDMRRTITANINAVAKGEDTLYFLGDWCCGVGPFKIEYIRASRAMLNVGTIHFIRGNHDPSVKRLQVLVEDGTLASVSEMLTIKWPGSSRDAILCHYPLEHWGFEEAGGYCLHGHCHGKGERHPTRRRLDIGVDGHEYRPWSVEEINAEMRRLPWKAEGHHG